MEQVILHIDTTSPQGKAELIRLRNRAERVAHMTMITEETTHKKEMRQALQQVKDHVNGVKEMQSLDELLGED